MTKPRFQQTVWITGAGGLIGNSLIHTAPQFAPHWRVLPLTRSTVDLLDSSAIHRLFVAEKPAAVIHCAAMSKSPDCQARPQLAHKLNMEVTALLAELAAGIPFVFFSSDLVFDGRKGHYVETDAVNPLNIYGETKAAAEKIVLPNPRHTVIRTSLNGGTSPTGDRGFNELLRRAWQGGRTLPLFTDEFRSPISARVTALAAWELIRKNCTGLFHVAGRERLSRWQIGRLLAARWPGLHPKMEAVSLQDYRGAARSPDTSLNCAKVQKLLSFPLPGLTDWLATNSEETF